MFLFRSAFWLLAAFLLLKPAQMDLGSAGEAAARATASAGRSAAIAGIEALPCDTVECLGTKFMVRAAIGPAKGSSQVAPLAHPPLPRPRIARTG